MSRKSSKNSGESQDSDVDMPHVDENLPFDPSSFLDQKRDCPHVSAIRVARLKRILPAALKSKSRRGCETCNKLRLTLTKPKHSDSDPPYRAISPPPSPPATPPPQLSLTDIPNPPQTLWLCLTCANLNCGRADLGHGLSHFELSRGIATQSQPASASEDDSGAERAPGHPLVMNIETGQSWCYECDAEILAGPEVNVVITECYAMVRADVKSAGGLDVLFNRVPAPTTSPAPSPTLPKRDDVLAPGLRNLGNLNCENCQRIHHPAFFNTDDGTLLPGAGKPPAMYRPAYKRLILLQDLPPVLVVGLKRFQTGYGGRTRKVQEWIRVPQVLEVRGVTASKSELGMGDGPSGGERGRARGMGAARKRAGREESGGGTVSGQPARKKSRSLSKEPTQLGTGLGTRLTASPEPTTGVVTRSCSSATKGSSMSPSRPGHMHRPNTPRPLSPSLRPPTPAEPEPDTTFQLRGVVVHSGYQLASGHYYAYVRAPVVNKNSAGSGEGGDDMDIDGVKASHQAGEEDVWVYASDTDIWVTTWEEVKGAQAFVLFFERV
ncbi:cysteine proteinase [Gonapodya prolifera JEL478]|uniref:Cysteine proteinase n=1 Tax=Gonapodya prolifera (strain JEL478) TaxID=1344416 RepID=A0A139AKJ9_GONPJ|nr:cysteine proteinase [Gonapodya prolifera JEL478]|eukprot:KXS17309.1 cysteine proteinase [Gonapodya prolifera JEL478]